MQRTKGLIALAILVLMAGMLSAQIKFPVTDDGTALTYGTVVSVDGTNPIQVVAADGTDRTQDVVGVVMAVQNVGGTDYYLVVTEGFLELSGASFTPGDRLTVNATGDIVTSTNDEDILIGYALSATRVQILIDDDQARFTYFDDTFAGLGADNVQDAIDSLNDMIGDITSEDITFEGVVTFDSTVIFGDDSAYFGGPVVFDSTVVFNGDVVIDQNIVQATISAVLEFDTNPTEAIALSFTTSGDVIELSATVVISDEYSTTPNYNGAKITIELYDATNTTVLKSYTVLSLVA